MARILFCLRDTALETALLCHGHTIRRANLPRGALAMMNLWQFRRAAAGFQPDFLLAGPGDAIAADTARQLGAQYAAPPEDAVFLADHWLSPPFLAAPARPTILYAGLTPLEVAGAEALALAGPDVPPVIPEIAALAVGEPALLAGLLGGGAVMVAPDTASMRRYIANGITGQLYPPGDMAALAARLRALVDDDAQRQRMAVSARAAFLARHRAAQAELRRLFG